MALSDFVCGNIAFVLPAAVLAGILMGDLLCLAWRRVFPPRVTRDAEEPPIKTMQVRRWPWCVRHKARPWWVSEGAPPQDEHRRSD